MQALPAAPAAPPRRQVFVGTALVSAGAVALIGGMLAVWYQQRTRAIDGAAGRWLPENVSIPEVAANVMAIGLIALVLFAQWAVYAGGRRERANTALALGLVALLALAAINAQVFVWNQIKLSVHDEAVAGYAGMFYAVTGAMVVLIVAGLVFTLVAAFRTLGGEIREHDRPLLAAHALYWYVITALFLAVWFVVYVTK